MLALSTMTTGTEGHHSIAKPAPHRLPHRRAPNIRQRCGANSFSRSCGRLPVSTRAACGAARGLTYFSCQARVGFRVHVRRAGVRQRRRVGSRASERRVY